MRFLAMCCLLGFFGLPSQAAEIRVLQDQTLTADEIEAGGCSLSLTGEIVAGDAARLREVLESRYAMEHDDRNPALCLDGPGGSLDEGVKIAELLGQHAAATVLPAGAECLSACAVAFMGGSFAWYEYRFNLRVMHPTARLGFHAPALNIADGAYDAGAVTQAFDVAVNAIARITGDLDEIYVSSSANKFPRSLLAQMLVHRGEDYLWVDTVEKAGGWDIWVSTDGQPVLDDARLIQACKAAERWLADRPKMEFVVDDWALDTYGQVTGGGEKWTVRYDELIEVTCEVERRESGVLSMNLTRADTNLGQRFLRPWMGFAPDTLLVDLQ